MAYRLVTGVSDQLHAADTSILPPQPSCRYHRADAPCCAGIADSRSKRPSVSVACASLVSALRPPRRATCGCSPRKGTRSAVVGVRIADFNGDAPALAHATLSSQVQERPPSMPKGLTATSASGSASNSAAQASSRSGSWRWPFRAPARHRRARPVLEQRRQRPSAAADVLLSDATAGLRARLPSP